MWRPGVCVCVPAPLQAFIAGEEVLTGSNNQQTNSFGYTNGYETLMHANADSWSEINFVDTTDLTPGSTYGGG